MKILFIILMFLSSRIIDAADCDNNETPSVENNSLALEKKRKQPDPESYTDLDIFKINLDKILDHYKKNNLGLDDFKSMKFGDISYLENAIRYGLIEQTLAITDLLGIDAFDERTGVTAAMLAVYYVKMDILDALIEKGADMSIKGKNLLQDTVKPKRKKAKAAEAQAMREYLNDYLIAACWGGSEKLVSYFLDNKADINARDGKNDNMTPLLIATKQNDIPLMKLLIARGADHRLRDTYSKGLSSYADHNHGGTWELVSALVADKDAGEKFRYWESFVQELYEHLNPVMHIVLEYSDASSMPQMLDKVVKKVIAEEKIKAQALKIKELTTKIKHLQKKLQPNS